MEEEAQRVIDELYDNDKPIPEEELEARRQAALRSSQLIHIYITTVVRIV